MGFRTWIDPVTNVRYRVRICPRERTGALGVDGRLNAVVFETTDGEWIGSVPIYQNIALWSLDGRDLSNLLDQAIARG